MKAIFLLPIFLIVFSCNNGSEKTPEGILEKEKFIEVLKDRALIEATLNVNIKSAEGSVYDSVYNFNVFKENNITQGQYDSTVKYYSSKPGEFKQIMEVVLEQLNIEKAKRL